MNSLRREQHIQSAQSTNLESLRNEVYQLQRELLHEALRRVLDLLIEWVERDPENAPNPAKSQTWAA